MGVNFTTKNSALSFFKISPVITGLLFSGQPSIGKFLPRVR